MSFNLLETVKNYFTNEFTNQASNSLGENSSGISKALSAIIPTGLAGILRKATSGNEGAESIFNMAKDAAKNFSAYPNVSNLSSQQNISGGNMFSSLFGGNQSGIIGLISKFAGIKDSSATALMGMGLPAMMGILGKHAEQNNMSPTGLSGFLTSQKDHIIQAIPSGLSSVAGMLGLGSLGASASSMASNIRPGVNPIEKKGGNKWLLPIIIILIAIALLWYFMRGCNKQPDTTVNTFDTGNVVKADTVSVPAVTNAGSIKVKLPNGKELDAMKGGIEDQLVTFLSSDWKSLSNDSLRNKWFDFDNLNFDLGKATIVPASEKQLDNLSEILKAFPDAKIKIGGYTDASGNAAANKKLSQDRADAAKDGLAKRGVGVQVTAAEGYGSKFAKYPATATEEERAFDRHVSLSVRK